MCNCCWTARCAIYDLCEHHDSGVVCFGVSRQMVRMRFCPQVLNATSCLHFSVPNNSYQAVGFVHDRFVLMFHVIHNLDFHFAPCYYVIPSFRANSALHIIQFTICASIMGAVLSQSITWVFATVTCCFIQSLCG